MTPNLSSQQNAPFILAALVGQFLPPRLDGEIGLTMRYNLLFRIGVLNSQIACVTRQEDGFNRTFRAAANGDHFGDVNEMVFDAVTTVETGQLGLLNYPLKIAVITVAP